MGVLVKKFSLIAVLTLCFMCIAYFKLKDETVMTKQSQSAPEAQALTHPLTQRQYNAVPTDYDPKLKAVLEEVVRLKSPPDDPKVVELVAALLEPPSQHLRKTTRGVRGTPQSKEIMKILKNKRQGFYIEVGALDGERSSNTIWLEKNRGWKGLLIEMDPYFYTMLKGHSRHAWSINCCLSPSNYTTMMDFRESVVGGGQLIDEESAKHKTTYSKVVTQVPCFPLTSLMLALQRTHIDYFSLDVEGFEFDILQTIPWTKLDISTFSVEYAHPRVGKNGTIAYMKDRGYKVAADIKFTDPKSVLYVNDLIFVKRDLK